MKSPPYTRAAALPQILKERIVILDGAMGTMIQRYKLAEADYRGERFKDHPKSLKGNNDLLQLTRPDVIAAIHEAYLRGRRRHRRDQHLRRDLGRAGRLRPRRPRARDERRRRAAGARGVRQVLAAPTSRASSPARSGRRRRRRASAPTSTTRRARNVTFDELRDAYREQAEGLLEGGCDLFLVETIFDTLNAKAALFALDELMRGQRRAPAGDRLRHRHRRLRPHPLGPDGRARSGTRVRHARPLADRPQLRARRGADAALHRGAGADRRRHLRQLLPERRPAQPDERDRLRRDARRSPSGLLEEFAQSGLRQHRRRLLRHHARAHRARSPSASAVRAARAALARAARPRA